MKSCSPILMHEMVKESFSANRFEQQPHKFDKRLVSSISLTSKTPIIRPFNLPEEAFTKQMDSSTAPMRSLSDDQLNFIQSPRHLTSTKESSSSSSVELSIYNSTQNSSEQARGSTMLTEVDTAVNFLASLLSKMQRVNCVAPTSGSFRAILRGLLLLHYRDHWYPDDPVKGSGYRCIRVNGVVHPILMQAAVSCNLPITEMRKAFPNELTIWVDPGSVSVRFGEEGGISQLYNSAFWTSEGNWESNCTTPVVVENSRPSGTTASSINPMERCCETSSIP